MKSEYEKELENRDFDEREISFLMVGEKRLFDKYFDKSGLLFNDDIIQNINERTDMTRKELIKSHLKKYSRVVNILKENDIEKINYRNYTMYTFPLGGLIPPSASHGMFEALIRVLGSDEQVQEYIPKILNNEIIGCYSQTEIGHGSDVRGLQTTAMFEPKEDCFIINTPTVKDAKFWPGELGKLATHAVLQANTYAKGKSIGIQTFLIQIRDMVSHRPFPNLEIGDIGTKYGFATKDNGYMIFNHFKVPRTALLSKYSKITKEGDYSVSGNPRVAYRAMMLIRVQLLESTPAVVYKSLMIALRYIVNRKQFRSIVNSKDERKIIDYQATKVKIASAIAFSWASRFTSYKCNDMYMKMVKEIEQKNKFKTMKDLHSFACALKAYYCDEVLIHLKNLRELMGGHGYLNATEMPEMIELVSPNVTLEGDG